jgi:RimJ/RimL family protein N-acetyltransferase
VIAPPVLTTPRLVLRGLTGADFEASAAMWAEPEVTRHILGRPSTRQESWFRLLRNVGHWPVVGFGFWAATTREGAFLGEIGFGRFERAGAGAAPGGEDEEPEAGWVLRGDAAGKGFATEAMRAAHDWLGSVRPAASTRCIIAPDNAASLRVAEKLGYREIGRTEDAQGPIIRLRRPG